MAHTRKHKRAQRKRKKENSFVIGAGGAAGATAGAAIGAAIGSKVTGIRKKKGIKAKAKRTLKKTRGATGGAIVGAAIGAVAGAGAARGALGVSRIKSKASGAYKMTAARKQALMKAVKASAAKRRGKKRS